MQKVKEENIEQIRVEEESQASLNGIAPGEIIIGVFAGIDTQGQALVDFQENQTTEPAIALSTVELSKHKIGRQVALLFANGNPKKPVIMGLIHSPLDAMIDSFEVTPVENHTTTDNTVEKSNLLNSKVEDVLVDGKRVVIEAQEEIVFKCGDASITLTKAGKILIRGKYLLNRSSGVNRIMGGSVQVN
jgi:hypothetical protein